MSKTNPKTIHLKDYTPTPYLIERVDLDVKLKPQETRQLQAQHRAQPALGTKGQRRSNLTARQSGSRASGSMAASSAEANEYSAGEHRAYACTGRRQGRSRSRSRQLLVPRPIRELTGLYLSNGIYCTQCEAEGFRRITYFLDRPDVLARYRVRLEADKAEAPVLLSNGNPSRRGDIAGTAGTSRCGTIPSPSPPIFSPWSPAISPSSKDSFTTMSGRKVELRIYVEHGKEDRCALGDGIAQGAPWRGTRRPSGANTISTSS